MGAYLSTPCTIKDSSDEKNDELVCGASSMQGWRINQEDAHNCELNFDKDASFFAVYDGHGGPEIALYCSKYLPEFLKSTEAYLAGDFEKALKDAFLGFDSKLLSAEVIEELKMLAGDKYGYGDDAQDTDSDEDLAELKQEGGMPIEAVLSKYRNMVKNSPLEKLKGEEVGGCSSAGGSSSSSSSGFKPHSPCLRAKKQAVISTSNGGGGGAADSLKEEEEEEAAAQKPSESCEEAVSSSCSGQKEAVAASVTEDNDATSSSVAAPSEEEKPVASSAVKTDADESEPGNSTKAAKPMESPDSSSTDAKIGNSEASEAAGSSSSSGVSLSGNGVSSSSAAAAAEGGSSSALSSSADVVEPAGGSSSSSSAAVANGESSSSSSSGISSTNVDRAAKRVALALNEQAAVVASDSDESMDGDENDMTYNENNSNYSDSDEKVDEDEDDDDDDEDDDDEEEEEEEDEDEIDDDDAFISNMVEEPGKDSGCTAVVAFRKGRNLYVANAGDSRCVLSRGGEVIEMSFDHKPEDLEEYTRINNAGGRVTIDGRVNGGLNLSRAIGDHAYKMNATLAAEAQMISAMPDVKKIELTDEDDFMVLACDGIWNFMSSEAVIQFVKTRLDRGETKLSKICEELFDHCLAKDTSGDGTGCDNMTAIVVRFKWPEKQVSESAEAAPALEVGLKRAASGSPLPVPEIAEAAEADGGIKAKRAKTEVDDSNAPTTTST